VLNPESPLPLYRQLADTLRAGIRSGDYPQGSRIPSEHELAARFGIGRPTVRQATDLLVRQRLLERRRGAGTFVCELPEEVDLFSLGGTSAAFLEKGIDVHTEYLEPLAMRTVHSAAGTSFTSEHAYSVSRLHRAETGPVLLEEIYLDPEPFRGIERFDLRGDSLSRIVADHFHLRPESAQQTFSVIPLDSARAHALELETASPALRVIRRLRFRGVGDAVLAHLFCRTDRYAFSQRMWPQWT